MPEKVLLIGWKVAAYNRDEPYCGRSVRVVVTDGQSHATDVAIIMGLAGNSPQDVSLMRSLHL